MVEGLKLTYQRLIDHKKKTNGPLIVERNGEIVHLDPHDLPPDLLPRGKYANQNPTIGVEEPDPDGEDPDD